MSRSAFGWFPESFLAGFCTGTVIFLLFLLGRFIVGRGEPEWNCAGYEVVKPIAAVAVHSADHFTAFVPDSYAGRSWFRPVPLRSTNDTIRVYADLLADELCWADVTHASSPDGQVRTVVCLHLHDLSELNGTQGTKGAVMAQ